MKIDNLKFYRIPTHSEAWYRFRETGLIDEDCQTYDCDKYIGGVGASEVGNILGLNKYRPVSSEIYHFKIGSEIQHKEDNRSMLLGRLLEPLIKDIWSCYDGDEFSWVDNYKIWRNAPPGERRKEQLRHAKSVNAYIVNTKYPWLFCSLDYFAEKDSFSLLTGENIHDGFVVEVKTINGFYANQWLAEIPPSHIAQINQQMLITDTHYCELAVLIDGRIFKCVPFERDEKLCTQVLEESYDFWKRVEKGREAFQAKNKAIEENKIEESEKQQGLIDKLEPMPDETVAYEDYMKERYKNEVSTLTGDDENLTICKLHNAFLEISKMGEAKKQHYKNRIIQLLDHNGASKLDFDVLGYVSYLCEGKKTKPTLRINIKDNISKEKIEEQFNKIKFEL